MATYKLTPDTGEVSGTNTDMPLVVIPSELEIGTLSTAEAESIRFYSDASLSTELPREVVSADEIHVKVSSVSSSTEIWADYDGIRSDYAATDTYGRNAVWGSEYRGVYHAGDSSTPLTDSTSNNNNATEGGSPTYQVAGSIGKAVSLDGNSDYFELGVGQPSQIQIFGTLKINALPSNSGSTYNNTYIDLGADGGKDTGIMLVAFVSDDNFYIRFGDSSQFYTVDTGVSVTLGSFKRYVVSYASNGDLDFYIDGSNVFSTNVGNGSIEPSTTRGEVIGFTSPLSGDNYAPIDFDEVYVVTGTPFSADWISTEHNNQNDNAAFWVATEVETVTASPIAHILQMI